jgi:hypothetical protein
MAKTGEKPPEKRQTRTASDRGTQPERETTSRPAVAKRPPGRLPTR